MRLYLRFLCCLAFQPLTAVAAPVGPLDVASVVDRSGLIIAGSVLAVGTRKTTIPRNDGIIAAYEITIRITVMVVLKGQDPGPSVTVRYLLPEAYDPNFVAVPAPSYRICFLIRIADQWIFTDSTYPSAPGVPAADREAGMDPLDAVVRRLRDVLAGSATRNDKVEALAALRSLPKRESVEAALLSDITNPDPSIRLDIVGALLARGNTVGLRSAGAELMTSEPGLPAYVLHNLRVGISEGLPRRTHSPC